MLTGKTNYILVLAAALLLLLVAGVAAQETQKLEKISDKENIPQFEKDISVRLQLVDVTVMDSAGKYVKDLKPGDFVLTVDGRERDIKTFDIFYPGARVEAPAEETGEVPELAAPPRSIVLFFDLAFTSYKGYRNARSAAKEFVLRNLSPGDQVMIVGFDRSLKVYQDFTSDREKLAEAIDDVNYNFSNPATTKSVFVSENQYNLRIYLQALRKMALNLKALRGRKTIVMMSEGFDQRIALYSLPQYLKDTLDAFNNSNSTIFTVDVLGLNGQGTPVSTKRARHDTLSTFANETGGKFYRGSNDIDALLLGVDSDISNYYVLGFYVEDQYDGGYKDINVRVKRSGTRLLYRKGFFSPKPYKDMNGDEKLVHLKEGLYRNIPLSEYDARIGASVYPREDGSAVANLIIESPMGGADKPEFEIYGLVYSLEEKLIDAFHKRFEFSSRPSGDVFRHVETVNLQTGENLIKLVIRDNVTGERAYQFIKARMPELSGVLLSSTIAFQEQDTEFVDSSEARVRSFKKQFEVPQTEPADPLAPLAREDVFASPALELKRGGDAGVILRMAGVERGERGLVLTTSYTLRAGDGTSYEPREKDLRIFPVAGAKAAIVLSVLDISELPPGDYTLRASIEDGSSGRVVGKQTQVIIK